MTDLAHTLFFFVIALGVLITIHEFGHFWVARRVGVKVLRFSIGFGKPLWKFQKSPASTEFVIAAVPLGGYVKMADEREGKVAESDLPFAFNRQPLLARTAIVLAGPLFNLLLAVCIYWLVFAFGETGVRPVLGPVEPGTLAAEAGFQPGDEIVAVAGEQTPTWALAMGALFTEIMDSENLEVMVRAANGEDALRVLHIPQNLAMEPERLRSRLGFRLFEPELPAVIGKVEPNSPAEAAGLQRGDVIVSADGVPVENWAAWVEVVRAKPNQAMALLIERRGVHMPLTLKPAAVKAGDASIGRIGASVDLPPDLLESMNVEYRLGFLRAFGAAIERTADYSLLTLKMIGRMLIGSASVENLSGPISIAQYAGESAEIGLGPFLKFLAIVSISLGVLNLLPIPVLDGGHLLFFVIEAVKGSPLSDSTQLFLQQLGIAILLCVMFLAFFLDIDRLFA